MIDIADISAEEIARLVGKTGFSGVVSLAPLGSGPSLDLGFGLADRSHRVPNTVETRFAMASGCKIFTALAVGSLIQEGKIDLDTTLAECVRSRHFHFGSIVTVGQLLNHTAGIPDYFDEELESDYGALWRDRPCYRMTSVRDFLPLFENAPVKAPPGQRLQLLQCRLCPARPSDRRTDGTGFPRGRRRASLGPMRHVAQRLFRDGCAAGRHRPRLPLGG